jgi:Amt family ammonium transporter
VTHVATAGALVSWVACSWLMGGKPSVVGAAAGAVAGLVAITPAAGFVTAMPALGIGIGAGAICYAAVQVRIRIGLDDSLDVVGVHGVGGAWGAISVGLFAAFGGAEGLFKGNEQQLLDQVVAVAATIAYSFIVTYVILRVIDATIGLRVSEDEEIVGVDVSEHGERAYLLDSGGASYAGIPVTPESGGSGS